MADVQFKFVNYDGGFPSHPSNEEEGRLVLTLREWQIHYGGRGFVKGKKWIKGGLARYVLNARATGPKSCHVTFADPEDPSVHGSLDLPDTSAEEFEAAYAAAAGNAHSLQAQSNMREALTGNGAWWLEPNAFRGLGMNERFSASDTHYLGGWPGYTKTHTGKLTYIIAIDKKGISLSGMATLFTIPWEEVISIEIDGPENASKRVTATRVVALGVFALAAKKGQKMATILVETTSGDIAIFQTEKMLPSEVQARLMPILTKVNRRVANPDAQNATLSTQQAPSLTPPLPGTPAGWLADPSGRFEHRYWDGNRWTEHVASAGNQSVDLV